MNIHLMTKETHPTAGYENVYATEYLPEEYAEVFTAEQRAVLDAGKPLRITERNGWVRKVVRMDVLALATLN